MLTQHNRKTCRLSPDYTFAIRELGVWSGDETTWYSKRNECTKMNGVRMLKTYFLATTGGAYEVKNPCFVIDWSCRLPFIEDSLR